MNSRYKFQYICSYNASESFDGEKSKDGFDKIICIPKIDNIKDNKIIYKFNEIYDNKERNDTSLFYCSRIDIPEKNEYINEEYCNMENNYKSLIPWIDFLFDMLKFVVSILIDELDNIIKNRLIEIAEELRQIINILTNVEDKDTEYDEENDNNISFNEEEDQNIIFENHNIIHIDANIKDYIENEGKQKID